MPGDGDPPPSGSARYRGRVVDVDVESVRLPGGVEAELELVRHPGGAAVVAVDAGQQVCLLRQYRHAAGGWLWELPAGKRDRGEDPEETARRELAEEAGLRARTWSGLGDILSSPGVFTEVIHLYLARDLQAVERCPEPHEVFEVHWLALREAAAWALDGRIRDAKTVIGLCRAATRLGSPLAPER